MSHRFGSGTLAIVLGVVSMTSVVDAGQAGAAQAKAKKASRTKIWTPPLTPDGQPDLQGVWLSKSATPLERPKAWWGERF
jgi:hypothetical protein